MPKEKREVGTGLGTKGFRQDGGDHNYFIYWSLSGKKSMAKTKTSHGSDKDLYDELLSKMAKQCGLTKKQFLDLIECPLQRDAYEELLIQRNMLARDGKERIDSPQRPPA